MNFLTDTKNRAVSGMLLVSAIALGATSLCEAREDKANTPLQPQVAAASSTWQGFTPDLAIDGVISDDSRWLSERSTEPSWLEVDLDGVHELAGIHLYTGYQNGSALEDFKVQFWKDDQWHDIPSATFKNNQAAVLVIPFYKDVTTDRLRLWITKTPSNTARVLEMVVWPASVGALPPLSAPPSAKDAPRTANEPVPLIYLNQSGFNLGEPKRFTAPTLADGTTFEVRALKGGPALFTGTLKDHIGDFTAFNPTDEREYIVEAGGKRSVPFRIGMWWLERVTYQNAVDFMIESRHYVGNSDIIRPFSFAWRGAHHYGLELNTLVPQFLSNPSAYERMPHKIHYEAPGSQALIRESWPNGKQLLEPEPPATQKLLWGRLEPYREDAPDIVKLIHWGADVIVTQGLTNEMQKCQLAYFLYAWPWLKPYLPQQNYDVVRDFTFKHWSDPKDPNHVYKYGENDGDDLLKLKTRVGYTKGSYPPGFSIQPNLMLYEVANREGRADADEYFEAAFEQTEWVMSLDWNDPQVTKGQRQGEFVTMTSLAYFLQKYPDLAPAGLADSINAWAKVMIRRSNNLWDFRKLDDGDRWVPKDKENFRKWNEPGNVVGFPAALLAAEPFVTDAATRARMDQLVWSHFDNMFGRNPTGRCFSFHAPRDIEGVEHGWYSVYQGGVGHLTHVHFALDGSPKNEHYPYHPEVGNVGWSEAWIQFNTPFNESLAYLARAKTHITLRREGDKLLVRLEAPLNFDYDKVESGKVWLTTAHGDAETLVVTEDSANSRFFSGQIKLDAKPTAQPSDGTLQAGPGGKVEAGYGYGYMGRRTTLSL